MMADSLRREILNIIKMHGLCVTRDAQNVLVQFTNDNFDDDRKKLFIDSMIDELLSSDAIADPQIGTDIVIELAKRCKRKLEGRASQEEIFSIENAYSNSTGDLFSEPNDKAQLFIMRYSIVKQRLDRHPAFQRPAVAQLVQNDVGKTKFEIRSIDSLHGCSQKLQSIITLGMLSQLKDGKLFLEDPTGYLELDLQNAEYKHSGIYTEGSIVLVEGSYDDSVMKVQAIGLPPIGCQPNNNVVITEHASRLVVFVSDVWLDSAPVLDRLQRMLDGFDSHPPLAFVLIGNFRSSPSVTALSRSSLAYSNNPTTSYVTYGEGFQALSRIIAKFKGISQHSHFILIPGSDDFVPLKGIFPLPALIEHHVQSLRNLLKEHLHLATNPTTLRCCGRKIVIFREDLVQKACRCAVKMPSSQIDLTEQLARTVLSQGYLVSVPLHACAIHWTQAASMALEPLPNLLVLADSYDPYTVKHSGVTVINPGCFQKSKFGFKVYIPSENVIQDSIIPD